MNTVSCCLLLQFIQYLDFPALRHSGVPSYAWRMSKYMATCLMAFILFIISHHRDKLFMMGLKSVLIKVDDIVTVITYDECVERKKRSGENENIFCQECFIM